MSLSNDNLPSHVNEFLDTVANDEMKISVNVVLHLSSALQSEESKKK